MSELLDVVNFNADASCLSATAWLEALRGGEGSPFCTWLGAYVEHQRKVSLGLTGATVADLAAENPEALALINDHPELFELLCRPFSHDVALLRSPAGFAQNLRLGQRCQRRAFHQVTPFFLPAEFMLTNQQLMLLADSGVEGVFINARRFRRDLGERIPETPYRVRGLFGAELPCVPLQGELTVAYLDALHLSEAGPWETALARCNRPRLGVWRDGETPFLIPEGIARERRWLAAEATDVKRVFVREAFGEGDFALPADGQLASYPVHSFSEWVREFRMFGFISRLQRIEAQLERFDELQLTLWLQAINSDILSAVEKEAPTIELHGHGDDGVQVAPYTIARSERGFEGEEFLTALECLLGDDEEARRRAESYLSEGLAPHLRKLRARRDYLCTILAD